MLTFNKIFFLFHDLVIISGS